MRRTFAQARQSAVPDGRHAREGCTSDQKDRIAYSDAPGIGSNVVIRGFAADAGGRTSYACSRLNERYDAWLNVIRAHLERVVIGPGACATRAGWALDQT